MSESGLRLTIFIGESDVWQHKPLYHEIVSRARDAGLAGATVLRGWEGFGGSSVVHTGRLLSVASDLPLTILIVDRAEKVRAFVPQLEHLVARGMAVLDEVEFIRYGREQT